MRLYGGLACLLHGVYHAQIGELTGRVFGDPDVEGTLMWTQPVEIPGIWHSVRVGHDQHGPFMGIARSFVGIMIGRQVSHHSPRDRR